MGFGYTRKQQKCTFLRCLQQSKFQLFISSMVEIVGWSTFGNVAGSAPVSLAVACTVCGASTKTAMLMCMMIRIGQNLGRNLLILYAQGYTFGENSRKAIRTTVHIGIPSRASYDVTDFDEFAESGVVGNLWQCYLPFLRKRQLW